MLTFIHSCMPTLAMCGNIV
uniref:Uncharacterized protein n=1 Tax=Anguilla anguilla TaxID=7936 RepID=A0A0E9RXQ9_ANGAN